MAHPSQRQDEIKKLQTTITERVMSVRKEYADRLSNHKYFQLLMLERPGLTIEQLAEMSNISIELVKKFRYDDNYSTTKETLRKVSLYGLALCPNEAETLFNRYGFTFERSRQKDDIKFREYIQNNRFVWNPGVLPSSVKMNLALDYVKKEPVVTKEFLADVFSVSTRTISRWFITLSVVNIGSRKTPIWAHRP